MRSLLIAGGAADGNLSWLADAAKRLGVPAETLFVGTGPLPAFSWNVSERGATIDGRPIDVAAAFIRYDVFPQLQGGSAGATTSALAWYAALAGLCEAEGAFTMNRHILPVSGSKPAMLRLAEFCGLTIPRTIVSNVRSAIEGFAASKGIAKPVGGGSYVSDLSEAIAGTAWEDGVAPSPAIVQPMLVYPERRIYRIGSDYFAFDIASRTLDSRLDGEMRITPVKLTDLPAGTLEGLARLTDRIRCDFCAVDMKTDAATGELVFLELNSGPMFMGYDRTAGGTMAEAMVRHLMAGAAA